MAKGQPKPVFDLRPFAASIEPGTILFIRNDPEAFYLALDADFNTDILSHPCVVVSPPGDTDHALILMLTTFNGRKIEQHVKQSYWQEYLPIAPSKPHTVHPDIQLHTTGAPYQSGGYINIVERRWIPWKLLTKWAVNGPVDQARFDDTSTELILHFMEWATYNVRGDVDFTRLHTPEEDYKERLSGIRKIPRHKIDPRLRDFVAGVASISNNLDVNNGAMSTAGACHLRAVQLEEAEAGENLAEELESELKVRERANRALLVGVVALVVAIMAPAVVHLLELLL